MSLSEQMLICPLCSKLIFKKRNAPRLVPSHTLAPSLPHPTPHISSFALFNDPQPPRLLALQGGMEGGKSPGRTKRGRDREVDESKCAEGQMRQARLQGLWQDGVLFWGLGLILWNGTFFGTMGSVISSSMWWEPKERYKIFSDGQYSRHVTELNKRILK